MRRSVAVGLAGVTLAAGCADLVGAHFDDPRLAPPPPSTCTVTAQGAFEVRLGDLVPSADRYDFCFARTDGTSVQPGVPVLASQGSGSSPGGPSSQGVGYEQVAAPLPLPAGAYDVAVIPAGEGCGVAPLATQSVCAQSGDRVALYVIGGGAEPVQVVHLAESAPPLGAAGARFAHAVVGAGPLDFGYADHPTLPAAVQPIVAGVAYGQAVGQPGDAGALDPNGYASLPTNAAGASLASAPAGTSAATMLSSTTLVAQHAYTVFAVGSAGDPRFPAELFACDETSTTGLLTSCGGVAYPVTVDTFDAFLLGPFASHESARRPALFDAISKLASDVVCLEYVMTDADKAALVLAAANTGHFYYSQWTPDTLATRIDDPTDQSGQVPPAPTSAPCASASAQAGLKAAYDCLSASCSTGPGDPTGTVQDDSVACIAASCPLPVEALIQSYPACWTCGVVELESRKSFADATTACTTDPRAGLLFDGTSGVLMLSRFPLTDPWHWVLPATLARSTLEGATIRLQSNVDVDVVCSQPTLIGDGKIVPYTGVYGGGAGTGASAWQAEVLLDTGKVVRKVASRLANPGRRVIVAGGWNTGPAVPGALAPNNPDSFALLTATLPQAVPFGFLPQCTYCASNPLDAPAAGMPNVQSTWGNYAVLGRTSIADVTDASVILEDNVVPLDGGPIPLSPLYGFRTTVSVRP